MVEWLQYNSGESYLSGDPAKDLMDLLTDKTRAAGHLLTFKEASSDPKMFRPYHYSAHFLSFERAAMIAWQKVQSEGIQKPETATEVTTKFVPQSFSKKELFSIKDNDNVSKEMDIKKGGTKMPRRYRRYDKSEVRAMLLNFYNANGRFPRMSEATEANSLPPWKTLTNTLGPRNSWDRLVDDGDDDSTTHDKDATNTEVVPTETIPVVVAEEPSEHAIEPAETVSVAIIEEPNEHEAETVEENTSTAPEPMQDNPSDEEKEHHPESDPIRFGDVEVDTSCEKQNGDSITIELKLTIPNREKPILITLTV